MSERNQESSFTAPAKSPGQSAITMRLTGAGAVEQSEQRTNTLRAAKKGASSTVIGMIFGCYALFDLLAALLVQIGAKFMFVAGIFVSGGVTIIFGILDHIPDGSIFIAMCFLVRITDVISFAAAMTVSFPVLAKAFPNNVTTIFIFSGLRLVLGPPLGGFLYQSCGYEEPFISLGCIVLLMVPLNMRILPDHESDPGEHSFWKLITLPKVTLMAFAVSSVSSCFGFLDVTLSLFVLEKFNLPAGYVGLIFLGLALSYAISSPCFGLLSDKMPVFTSESFFGLSLPASKETVVFGHFITAGCRILLGPVPVLHIKGHLWILFLVLVINDISAGMSVIPTFPEILSCEYAFIGLILGGFLYKKIAFEWAAAVQVLWALTSGSNPSFVFLFLIFVGKHDLETWH